MLSRDCCCREGTDMENFLCRQRLNLRFAQRDDRDGFPHSVEYFKAVTRFLARPTLMEFHDSRNVTLSKAVFRHIGS